MGTDLQDRIHSTQFPSHDQNRAIVLSLSLRLCPFATEMSLSHNITLLWVCEQENILIYCTPISLAILFCKYKYCRCVCMELHNCCIYPPPCPYAVCLIVCRRGVPQVLHPVLKPVQAQAHAC